MKKNVIIVTICAFISMAMAFAAVIPSHAYEILSQAEAEAKMAREYEEYVQKLQKYGLMDLLGPYGGAMYSDYALAEIARQRNAKPKCDHEYESVVNKEANCVETGEIEYTCTKCGDSYVEEIEINSDSHSFETVTVVEPTCTENGEVKEVCSLCNTEGETKSISALGHKEIISETVEPDCVNTGHNIYKCSVCSNERVEEIPALGHDEVSVYSAALTLGTLKFDGNTTYTCNRCGSIRVEEDPTTYPMWYVYVCCGILAIVIGIICAIVFKSNKAVKEG